MQTFFARPRCIFFDVVGQLITSSITNITIYIEGNFNIINYFA